MRRIVRAEVPYTSPGVCRPEGGGRDWVGMKTAEIDGFRTRDQRRRRSPFVVDVVLAAAATVFAIVALGLDLDDGETAPVSAYLVAVAAAGSLVLRRRHPVLVLFVVVAGRVAMTLIVGSEVSLLPVVAIALFTVAREGDRRSGVVIASVVAVAMALASGLLGDEAFAGEFIAELAQGLLPIAIADAARSREDRVRDLVEAEAEARVQAERLRIARDLHDVVAHGLSTIAIQSGVASHLLDRDPAHAKDALEVINVTGKSALEELRTMVGVLRSTDVVELRPAPTDPNDLGDLVEGARLSGVDARKEVRGAFPADVSDAAVVALHRIVQEALTNVARHAGPVRAQVRVQHGSDQAVVEIVNEPSGRLGGAVESTGVGIVGMRERAISLGGTFESGPMAEGGYRVRVTIPYWRQ